MRDLERKGFEVFMFPLLRPRSFQGWPITEMVTEMYKLERFIPRAKKEKFSETCVQAAEAELNQLQLLLSACIPRNPFGPLPLKIAIRKNRVMFYVTPKPQNNDKDEQQDR